MYQKKHKQLLIFDLDDTLIDTSDVYWVAKNTFIKIILHNSASINELFLDNLFEEIDTTNMLRLGHSPERYGKSMIDTYKILQDINLIKSDVKINNEITDTGKIIFERVPSLINGALELLEWCKERFTLSLITRGEEDLQLKKIYAYSLQKYFQQIKIVNSKTDTDFLAVIKSLKFDVKDTWIIGDSLKSEIETGLKIGAKCIFFNYEHSSYNWIQERGYSIKSDKTFYKINHLLEIPYLLSERA